MADPTDLLNNLRDIHTAPPVSWWPPAPGWWLLPAVFFAVVLWAWWWRRARPWRRQALRELQAVELEFQTSADVVSSVARLSVLLRRVALSARAPAAALTGAAWLKYLDELGRMQEFSNGIGRALASAPYARAESVDVPELIKLIRRWLKRVA